MVLRLQNVATFDFTKIKSELQKNSCISSLILVNFSHFSIKFCPKSNEIHTKAECPIL